MDTTKGDTTIRVKKILFMTNSESGQANTILAMALEATTRPHVEVHIASFPALKRRVERLSQKINFHPLDGKDMLEMMAVQGIPWETFPHPPTTKCCEPYDRTTTAILTVWNGECAFYFLLLLCMWVVIDVRRIFGPAYVRLCDNIKRIIEGVDPDIVVVDTLLNAGFDACRSLNRRFVMNSPNSPVDTAREYQPWLKGLWYYQMFVLPTRSQRLFIVSIRLGTGISFPVPWSDLLKNTKAAFRFLWIIVTSPKISKLNKYRNAHGLPGRLPVMDTIHTRADHVICAGVREIDFPLVVPDFLGLYGPIVLDTTPIETADSELNRWLGRGETVVMCMGTHVYYTESRVKAVINGFLGGINHDSNTQFLWKLSEKSKFESLIEETLKDPRDKDRFKIVDWLEADPASIMKHPNVIAYIHHGGANSYFEAAL